MVIGYCKNDVSVHPDIQFFNVNLDLVFVPDILRQILA